MVVALQQCHAVILANQCMVCCQATHSAGLGIGVLFITSGLQSQSWPSARDSSLQSWPVLAFSPGLESQSPPVSSASLNGQQKMPKNQATRGQTGGCERCFTRTNSESPRMLAKESDQINSEQECIENCFRLSLRAVKRVLCQSQSQCLARD